MWCFGDSALALCGDSGEIVAEATQISGLRDVSHICLGDRHACAASGGRVFCWGDQADGRLGNGATSGLTAEPVTFSAPWSGEVEALVCGSRDTLVVTNDGSQVWGWGRNDGSELGFGGPVLAPRQLAAAEGGARYEAYAGGHVCLVRRAPDAPDELLCAGRNNFGQLGLPGSASRDVLTPVPDLL